MTLQQFEYIIALDNYRHYVTAANETFVTQPTLSMGVMKLEEELGIVLFDRSKVPLEPTPTGIEIIELARSIIHKVKSIQNIAGAETNILKGNYNMAIIPTLSPYLLPRILPEMISKHPEVGLQIHELQTLEIIEGLNSGKIDFGLAVTPLEEKNIVETPLFYEPFYLFSSENDPIQKRLRIKPEYIDPDRLLLLSEGHCFRNQMINICNLKASQKRGINIESGSIESLKNLAMTGIGYTLVPALSIQTDRDKGLIKRFEGKDPIREVSLITHHTFNKKAILKIISEIIQLNIPGELKTINSKNIVEWR